MKESAAAAACNIRTILHLPYPYNDITAASATVVGTRVVFRGAKSGKLTMRGQNHVIFFFFVVFAAVSKSEIFYTFPGLGAFTIFRPSRKEEFVRPLDRRRRRR